MITPTYTFDADGFIEALKELGRFKRKAIPEMIREQARLLVVDLFHSTPPFPKIGKMAKGYKGHKEVGDNRVARDIKKVFLPIKDLQERVRNGLTDRTRKRINQLIHQLRTGTYPKALEALGKIMENIGFPRIAMNPDPQRHQSARVKGHVTKYGAFKNRIYVVNTKEVNDYIKKIQTHVGKTKAGWNVAAGALKVTSRNWPKWISKHATSGRVVHHAADGQNPAFVTVQNNVPWKADLRIDEIMGYATDFRKEAMKRQLVILKQKMVDSWNKGRARAARRESSRKARQGFTIRVGRFQQGRGIVSDPLYHGVKEF